jgi:hypothetical protein
VIEGKNTTTRQVHDAHGWRRWVGVGAQKQIRDQLYPHLSLVVR